MDTLTIPDAVHGGQLEANPNHGTRDGDHLQLVLMSVHSTGMAMDLDLAEVQDLHEYLGRYLNQRTTWPAKPADPIPAGESVLEEAQAAIYGDREDDYGTPRDNWTRTAILWTGLLHHKLADGEHITPEDGLRCMVAVKLARDVHSPKRDNRVDGAGYLALLDRLETGR